MIELYCGDCLNVMPTLTGPFDMILADLPYGTTACKWDTVIPFEPLWEQYKRLIKKRGAVVLFGSQPFTSALVMSNVEWFKYDWIWRKSRPQGHLNAKRMPLLDIEHLSVFGNGLPVYFPQGTEPCEIVKANTPGRVSSNGIYGDTAKQEHVQTETNYPRQILDFPSVHNVGAYHPTQKPVALLEYLIRTYTNEGETVLDNTMGSGSTGVACVNTGRNFVGIEKEREYFAIAKQRIEAAQAEMLQAELPL